MKERLNTYLKQFSGTLIINNKYITTSKELKEIVDNRASKIRHNIATSGFIIELNECIVNNTNVLEVE